MVVILASPMPETGRTQARVALPSRWMVQEPHWAIPQPYLVPTRARWSLRTHKIGVEGSTSTVRTDPLMFRLYVAIVSKFCLKLRIISIRFGALACPGRAHRVKIRLSVIFFRAVVSPPTIDPPRVPLFLFVPL